MVGDSDINTLWKELDSYDKELGKEAKSLQDIWVKISGLKAKTSDDMNKLQALPEFSFINCNEPVRLNVGGQIFDTTCDVLTKDPHSILASCCRKESSVKKTAEDDAFYFPRDWWLFRHILSFLRSNVLPRDLDTLKELYTEASFYRLNMLRQAIEDIPVHQISETDGLGSRIGSTG